MNKLLSIALLVVTFYSYSQDSNVRFGIQGGANYSAFWGYDTPGASYSGYWNYAVPVWPNSSEKPGFGYVVGLNVGFPIKQRFHLKIELNYERKSQKTDITMPLPMTSYNNNHYTITQKYDYLVLPVLLKYDFADENSFYLNGGPFIGYLLKSKTSSDVKIDNMGNTANDLDTTKNNTKTDFGFSLGLGKNFDLRDKSTLYLELRENLGLVNTSKQKVYDGGTVKTNSFNLLLGYSFN